jgi:hypothetical protein
MSDPHRTRGFRAHLHLWHHLVITRTRFGDTGGLVVGVVLLALTAAACGSEATAPTVESTRPPTTTAAPTPSTEPASTTTDEGITSTTTTPFVSPGPWNPPCVERSGSAGETVVDDADLATFGPLGPAPILTIELPSYGDPQYEVDDTVTAIAGRIPGGLLVAVGPAYESNDRSMLTVIDHSGDVRWVRCLEVGAQQMVLAPATEDPPVALIGRYQAGDGDGPTWSWWGIDPLDGSDVQVPDELELRRMHAQVGRLALFGPAVVEGEQLDPSTDDLLLVDLVDLTSEVVPLPAQLEGEESWSVNLGLNDDGTPFLRGENSRTVIAIYDDGNWSAVPDVIDAALPPSVEMSFDTAPVVLDGRTASGRVLWTRPDLTDINREGFRIATVDDVTIVAACAERVDDFQCAREVLVGLDAATGETLWERSGPASVQTSGDGLALITDGSAGYVMIDTNTGQPISDDQRWSDTSAFVTECCGGEMYAWVDRLDAIVVVSDYDRLNIWYPVGVETPARTVTTVGDGQVGDVAHDAHHLEVLGRVDRARRRLPPADPVVFGDDAADHHGASRLRRATPPRRRAPAAGGCPTGSTARSRRGPRRGRSPRSARGEADAAVHDLHPGVAGGHGDLLGAVGVPVEPGLGHEQLGRPAGQGVRALGHLGRRPGAMAPSRRGRRRSVRGTRRTPRAARAGPLARRAAGPGQGDRGPA